MNLERSYYVGITLFYVMHCKHKSGERCFEGIFETYEKAKLEFARLQREHGWYANAEAEINGYPVK